MIKDLSLVSPDAEHVVLLDDRPEYAWNGDVMGVPEYRAHVRLKSMVEKLFEHVTVNEGKDAQHLTRELLRVLKRDFDTHPRDPRDFSGDHWMHLVAPAIRKLFGDAACDATVGRGRSIGFLP